MAALQLQLPATLLASFKSVSRIRLLSSFLFMALTTSATAVEPMDNWYEAARNKPLTSVAGAFDNMQAIRQWVLYGQQVCSDKDKHILFDGVGNFLTDIPTRKHERKENQNKINQMRQSLAQQARIDFWSPGKLTDPGYPFALACEQPDVDMKKATERFLGQHKNDRFHGTFAGVKVGSNKHTASLHEALKTVYETRRKQGKLTFSSSQLSYLSGQVLIESGGRRNVKSAARAVGVLQLLPSVLKKCGVQKGNYFNRIAQIDCALQLTEQNHRLLKAPFEERFSSLALDKKLELYDLLLIQAYHGGVGRLRALLVDPELSKPAQYYAKDDRLFSAGDIAFGMIFNNLGKKQLGMASLYYVADVTLAARELCNHKKMRGDSICRSQLLSQN